MIYLDTYYEIFVYQDMYNDGFRYDVQYVFGYDVQYGFGYDVQYVFMVYLIIKTCQC